jgi:hypothetical protein
MKSNSKNLRPKSPKTERTFKATERIERLKANGDCNALLRRTLTHMRAVRKAVAKQHIRHVKRE